jgi:hypothetical protein
MIIQGFESHVFPFDGCFPSELIRDLKIFDDTSFLGDEIDFFPVLEPSDAHRISSPNKLQIDEIFEDFSDIPGGIPPDEAIAETHVGNIVFVVDFEVFFGRWILGFGKVDKIGFLPILQIGEDGFRRKLDFLGQKIIADAFRAEYAPDIAEKIPVEIFEKCHVSEAEMSNDILEENG